MTQRENIRGTRGTKSKAFHTGEREECDIFIIKSRQVRELIRDREMAENAGWRFHYREETSVAVKRGQDVRSWIKETQ